jgi:hypothetical protein
VSRRTTRSFFLPWFLLAALATLHGTAAAQTLEGFAKLPADTFAPGPTSGQLITPANGRVPPFENQQPFQGISSVLPGLHGDFWVMPDNGFGAKENSPDFVLRVYQIDPDFRTRRGGSGTIEIKSFISLHDPDHKINFPIVADAAMYPGSTIPVDRDIRKRRLSPGRFLTSNRFGRTGWDPVVRRRMVRFSSIPTRMVGSSMRRCLSRASSRPMFLNGGTEPAQEQGLRGMAVSCDEVLYPMLEGPRRPTSTSIASHQRVPREDPSLHGAPLVLSSRSGYLHRQSIGDYADQRPAFLVIERDNFEARRPSSRRSSSSISTTSMPPGSLSARSPICAHRDPRNLAGFGRCSGFPSRRESVIVLGRDRLGVLNDNNYPFSAGRVPVSPTRTSSSSSASTTASARVR